MYGKFFASAFTGSMHGSGPTVFALWAYILANTVDSEVEVNPVYVSHVIGTTVDDIQRAIDFLCAPDQHSRSKEEEGKRLIKLGEFSYHVVNHEKYRKILSEDHKREYFRVYRRNQRESQKQRSTPFNSVQPCSTEFKDECGRPTKF